MVERRFACQPGCTACCTQKGFVYLTEEDIPRAATYLKMTPAAFEKRYVYRTSNQRRLRVPSGSTCYFLEDGGCGIHPAKPTQCRAFPFWPELLGNAREWFKTGQFCPGIGQGELINIEEAQRESEAMRTGYPHWYEEKK